MPDDHRESQVQMTNHLKWQDNSAVQSDGTVWTITPFPGYDGSAASVVLESRNAQGTLTSLHRNALRAMERSEALINGKAV